MSGKYCEKNISTYISLLDRGGDPCIVDKVISYSTDYELHRLNIKVNNSEEGKSMPLIVRLLPLSQPK
jgi:hypothetical protein